MQNGKGDDDRTKNWDKYRKNHDKIFGKKPPKKETDEKKPGWDFLTRVKNTDLK